MRSLNIGELNLDVTIEYLSAETVDTSGAPSPGTWKTLCSAAMKRDNARIDRSGENFRADQLSASSVTRWVMRYLEDMDPDLVDVPKERRLVYLGRVYDILAADLMDRRVGIILRTLAASKVTVTA